MPQPSTSPRHRSTGRLAVKAGAVQALAIALGILVLAAGCVDFSAGPPRQHTDTLGEYADAFRMQDAARIDDLLCDGSPRDWVTYVISELGAEYSPEYAQALSEAAFDAKVSERDRSVFIARSDRVQADREQRIAIVTTGGTRTCVELLPEAR